MKIYVYCVAEVFENLTLPKKGLENQKVEV